MKRYNKKKLSEAQVIPLDRYVNDMVTARFSYVTDVTFRSEMKQAVARAIIPILKKYGYIVQSTLGHDWTGIEDVDLDENFINEVSVAIESVIKENR